MKVQLLRNATIILTLNGKTILVDPMLAGKGSYPPIQNTSNTQMNPVINLPISFSKLEYLISEEIDAVLLTHLHNDHWDQTARNLLKKDIPVYCQPADLETIRGQGFTDVRSIDNEVTWEGIQIKRTSGQHGTGDIGKKMGNVSGYMIRFEHDNLYIAGDTIWCPEVQQAIDDDQPDNIVLNGGAARFVSGDPIVMDTNDIIMVCRYALSAKIYVVHLEAVNHSMETRKQTRGVIAAHHFEERCFVPEDGDTFINHMA